MKEIDELIDVVDHLLGPNGCPWDKEQTMKSIRRDLLEEVSELIEAIDLEDNNHIKEEMGDLFFHAVFLSRLGEKEGRFRMSDAIAGITEKMIRRHPHVFAQAVVETSSDVVRQWDEIKTKEKSERKSALDGIPKGLSTLARAWKMVKAMQKLHYPELIKPQVTEFHDEKSLGELLFQIVRIAREKGLDAEQALRSNLAEKELSFRQFEGVGPQPE